MKSHKSVLYHPTAHQFQSAVFGFTDRSELPPVETDAEIRQSVLSEWKNDRETQKLVKLAYVLGVGQIILANRDTDDFLGQYICARGSRDYHEKSLKPWNLSRRQLAMVYRALSRDRDVISYDGDFAATLAHELGHYINRRLGGLDRFELSLFKFPAEFSRVTENMRRVARFGEYFFQSKDEYYAETWSRFLCGEKNRTLFRYLNRPLGRLRMKHPQKTQLILELAKTSCNRTRETSPGHSW
jgi:hypothetical protein